LGVPLVGQGVLAVWICGAGCFGEKLVVDGFVLLISIQESRDIYAEEISLKVLKFITSEESFRNDSKSFVTFPPF
jgi:hypothetical protein